MYKSICFYKKNIINSIANSKEIIYEMMYIGNKIKFKCQGRNFKNKT